jgi:hypothetical protein
VGHVDTSEAVSKLIVVDLENAGSGSTLQVEMSDDGLELAGPEFDIRFDHDRTATIAIRKADSDRIGAAWQRDRPDSLTVLKIRQRASAVDRNVHRQALVKAQVAAVDAMHGQQTRGVLGRCRNRNQSAGGED